MNKCPYSTIPSACGRLRCKLGEQCAELNDFDADDRINRIREVTDTEDKTQRYLKALQNIEAASAYIDSESEYRKFASGIATAAQR